ncbi:MAG: hypothetical protein ACD_8C00034G0012 [uncultured bacterium]|nr:MAG: hypothetical protein ACD_8C00034G0012 [uncultured bacterium]
MKTKWLKKGCFLIFAVLLATVPFLRLSASFFESGSVVELINKDRAERNILPLTIDQKLSEVAKKKAQDMLDNDYFAHTSPSGVTPWHWFDVVGYDYSFAGENLAINFSDPAKQHQALMNSETHKRNILNEKYEEIGVAVVKGKIDGKQTIITVQEFGTKMKSMPVQKTVAGLSMTKATADGINSGKVSWKNRDVAVNAVQKIPAMISQKISAIPLAIFAYVSFVMILFVFFAYEVMHGHMHVVFRYVSLKGRTIAIPVGIVRYKNISLAMLEDRFINFGRIYITHMKMRH